MLTLGIKPLSSLAILVLAADTLTVSYSGVVIRALLNLLGYVNGNKTAYRLVTRFVFLARSRINVHLTRPIYPRIHYVEHCTLLSDETKSFIIFIRSIRWDWNSSYDEIIRLILERNSQVLDNRTIRKINMFINR